MTPIAGRGGKGSAAAPIGAWFAFVAALCLALNGLGGLLGGRACWRWGLPYAIFRRFAGDLAVRSPGPRILAGS